LAAEAEEAASANAEAAAIAAAVGEKGDVDLQFEEEFIKYLKKTSHQNSNVSFAQGEAWKGEWKGELIENLPEKPARDLQPEIEEEPNPVNLRLQTKFYEPRNYLRLTVHFST
jgi:hypothetical protein